MRYAVLAILFFCLVGCANYKAALKMPYEGPGNQVTIIDERPDQQKEQAIMSLNIANCKYGSYQMGDENQQPSRIKMLENYLAHQEGMDFNAKPVKLKNFTIHVNAAAQFKGSLSNTYSGALSNAIINKKKIGCSHDDLFGGYSLGELTDNYPPIIAVIDVEIDNKIYHGRALRSLEDENWGARNPKWNFIVQDVIVKASEALVKSINNDVYTN